jgi:hypothetical protein
MRERRNQRAIFNA